MANKLNWGILTTGRIARKFATDLPLSRAGKLVAVGARRLEEAKKFAADFGGVRAHGSYEDLLADPEVDVVYIGTPHPWHAEWAIKAAVAGKHILCEKPLTLRLADTERVIAAAQHHQVLLMEAYMYRFHPQTRNVVALVQDGAVGDVQLIRASFNLFIDFNPEHRMFNKALGGGTILDLGGYPVTYARHIAGAVQGKDFADAVEFHGTGRLRPETGTDDFATAVAKFPGNILAEISCGASVLNDYSVQIHGTRGWLEVPNPFTPGLEGRSERIVLHRKNSAPENIIIARSNQGLYAYEADAVADALADGRCEVPLATWDDTRGTARMLDAWLDGVGLSYR